jgi:hypothetical protein
MAAEDTICAKCIQDPILEAKIAEEGIVEECDFCHEERSCRTIGWLADIVDPIMRENYVIAPDAPHVVDWSDNIQYWQDGDTAEEILADLLSAEPSVIEALVEELSSREEIDVRDGGDALYGESPLQHIRPYADEFLEEWERFEERVKHKVRFFDSVGKETLDELFGDLPHLSRGLAVVTLEPEAPVLFRARIVADETQREAFLRNPAKELGPPPPPRARAGRMNPAGISAFYGAFSEDVALSEIRPPVGALVAVGQFSLVRQVRLLDITFLPFAFHEESIFSERYQELRNRIKFVSMFNRRISQPVLPTDEALAYIPTQAVAAYVANVMGLDGMIYSSVQVDADGQTPISEQVDRALCNIVLFGDAAVIETIPPSADQAPPPTLRAQTQPAPKLTRISSVKVTGSTIFSHVYDDGQIIIDELEDEEE